MNQVKVICEFCGKEFLKYPCYVRPHNFCCREHAKDFLSRKMSAMNKERNPTRMRPETQQKIRVAHLAAGNNGKTYEKTRGRHTHRLIAEQILGRSLCQGEVVHHKDKNRRNNNPDNLQIFSSQSEHAKFHAEKRR